MSSADPATSARKDDAHIDRDWVVRRRLIDGVQVREVSNIVTANGVTTELYRPDWGIVEGTIQQAIHVALRGHAISAWHQHQQRWDYVFVVGGHLRVVLHDPREGSPTRDQVDVFHLSPARPRSWRFRPASGTGCRTCPLTCPRSSTCSIVRMTTRIRTSGASRPTARTSPTASASEAFVLTLWTGDPVLAARADAAGVDRVGVDLERLGKAERQRGLGTWISPHTESDVVGLRGALRSAALFARVNPLNDDSSREVDAVVAAGARVLMLPMVATAEAAGRFAALVRGRAHVVLLVERREALDALPSLAAVAGVDEIHIGLNDLALSLGLPTRWAILAGDRLAEAGAIVRAAGKRFGFGGIGRPGDTSLPMPADLIYAEYARTGATAALIARAFPQGATFAAEIARARTRLSEWRTAGADAIVGGPSRALRARVEADDLVGGADAEGVDRHPCLPPPLADRGDRQRAGADAP